MCLISALWRSAFSRDCELPKKESGCRIFSCRFQVLSSRFCYNSHTFLMLNLDQYSCLGAALRDALDRWPNETCLIEADRDREKTRLTYSDFKDVALPLARALQDAEFHPGDRAAIIMTNQSKWLISAYAIFHQRRRSWCRLITS